MRYPAAILTLLSFAAPAAAQSPDFVDRLARTAGRLHPMAVHFPIALIVTAGAIELYRGFRRKASPSPAALVCLSIGAAAACFAAFSGWMNASYESVTSNTAEIHRWLGVSLAALSAILAITGFVIKEGQVGVKVYRLGLVIAMGLVAYGGHLGGVLTHGDNYITDAVRDLISPRSQATTAASPTQPTPMPATLADIKFPADGKIDFNRDVRPIFALSCFECHGEKKRKGGLRMDVKAAAMQGGKGGPLFIAGKPAESQIIERVKGLGEEQRMPADNDPLPDECIRILEAWVAQGAQWPDDGISKDQGVEEKHWAYIKPIRHDPPAAASHHPIDRFILAKLKEKNLSPSPEADKSTLIRRASLDLTGLPPSLDDLNAFLADTKPHAYDRLIDRLLASPRYGEHMARSWLDLARYADSNGYEKDGGRSIWPYRDWVIDALNADMPYDRFTLEQLAGDLLPNPTQASLIATGFHRNSMINEEGGVDPEEYRINAVIDRANTTATVWLGQTLACAQCHDHKFDPFTQKDYYSFFAFFNDSPEESRLVAGSEFQEISPKLTIDEHNDTRSIARQLESFAKAVGQGSPEAHRALSNLEEVRNQSPRAATTLVMRSLPKHRTTHILNRGSFLSPGEPVEPDVPATLGKLQTPARPTRASLARWLMDPDNPLTARVTVNRLWEHHFGRGLVETSEDFGTRGSLPTHPELLDYLSTELVRQRWSLKAIHRMIVTSATYKQSSRVTPAQIEADPNNIWLARAPRPRLTGEIIRDQALAIGGLLSPKMGGPPVFPVQPDGIWQNPYSDNKYTPSTGEDRYRRSIYTYWKRSSPYPSFTTFDAPPRQVSCTRRPRTNTPLQALTTLNDPVFFEAAAGLAKRIVSLAETQPEKRIDYAMCLCLGRAPAAEEMDRLLSLYTQQREAFQRDLDSARKLIDAALGREAPPANQADLAAWTMVANVLLNLDEVLNRG
jgi:uncharacterized membrane protein